MNNLYDFMRLTFSGAGEVASISLFRTNSKRSRNTDKRHRFGFETGTNGIEKKFPTAKSVHFCSGDERIIKQKKY